MRRDWSGTLSARHSALWCEIVSYVDLVCLMSLGFGIAAEFVVLMLVRPVCRYVRVYSGSEPLGAVLARHGWDNPARGPQVVCELPPQLEHG